MHRALALAHVVQALGPLLVGSMAGWRAGTVSFLMLAFPLLSVVDAEASFCGGLVCFFVFVFLHGVLEILARYPSSLSQIRS
jgi:hypothetical protein